MRKCCSCQSSHQRWERVHCWHSESALQRSRKVVCLTSPSGTLGCSPTSVWHPVMIVLVDVLSWKQGDVLKWFVRRLVWNVDICSIRHFSLPDLHLCTVAPSHAASSVALKQLSHLFPSSRLSPFKIKTTLLSLFPSFCFPFPLRSVPPPHPTPFAVSLIPHPWALISHRLLD